MQFQCPHCHSLLRVKDGVQLPPTVRCPKCQSEFSPVPHQEAADAGPPPLPSATTGHSIYCPKCGAPNGANNFRCTDCAFVLQGSGSSNVATTETGFESLIPSKNSSALVAYYLGVFSLIPCFGIPLGITALIMGISGIRYAGEHPEARGKVHAWVGVVLGGLCALANIIFLVIAVVGIMNARRH